MAELANFLPLKKHCQEPMKLTASIFTLLVFFSSKANAVELYDRDSANKKLMPILSALKIGIKKRDVSVFQEYVSFPLNVSSEEKYVTADGSVKLRTKKVLNADALQKQFDSVFTPTVVSLIDCITPENMMYNKYKGFDAAYGGIWFFDVVFESTGKRIFALASISTNKTATEKWMTGNCGKTLHKPIQPTPDSGLQLP